MSTASMRVVVALDSFKGSLDAGTAVRAFADGWRRVRPDDRVIERALADGGEGTMDAYAAAVPAARAVPCTVVGPDDRPVDTHWLHLPPTTGLPGGTAVVELAATSGITLLQHLDPLGAHTFGFGQAIGAAVGAGVSRLVLALGGSSSTDGGAGALVALGAALLDRSGHPIALGNEGLAEVAEVDLRGLVAPPPGGATILSDVRSPLLGPTGATAVFGSQKGADAEQLRTMEMNLARLESVLGGRPDEAGSGAAGGAAYGLCAWGARIAPGADAVAEAVGLERAMVGADLVVAGEGRFDAQTVEGKAPSLVARLAAAADVPAALVAGRITGPTDAFVHTISLTDLASMEDSMRYAARLLRQAGTRLAEAVGEVPRHPRLERERIIG